MSDELDQLLERASRLENVGRNLVGLASDDQLGPVFDRLDMSRSCVNHLNKGHNLLLVGDSGVGKGSVVRGAAISISRQSNPPCRDIVETTSTILLTACLYARMLEEKLTRIFKKCGDNQTALFVRGLHETIGAGSASNNPHDLSTLLNNLMQVSGDEFPIIGSTTPYGLKLLERMNPQLVDRFVRVDVPPANATETLKMLRSLRPEIEHEKGLAISEDALTVLVRLCERFVHGSSFPGKAFRILEDVTALSESATLQSKDVNGYFQQYTGLPDFMIFEDIPFDPNLAREHLKSRVFDQDDAVDELVRAIARFNAGLCDPTKPIAALLFQGPSGVGKTELSKALAEFLFGDESRLLTYQMGHFSNGDEGYRRLLGSPAPSIERLHESGKLLDDVRLQPFSTILLDEADQASAQILRALYSIIDEGRYIDQVGRAIDFSSSILILTTNVGAHGPNRSRPVGFDNRGSEEAEADRFTEQLEMALECRFGAAFLNRVTVIRFHELDRQHISSIAEKLIKDLADRLPGLAERKIRVRVKPRLMKTIVTEGYQRKYGARAMHRAIRKRCLDPLACYLSMNPGICRRTIYLDLNQNENTVIKNR